MGTTRSALGTRGVNVLEVVTYKKSVISLCFGQGKEERRAVSQSFRFSPNTSAVGFDDSFNYCQTNTRTL